MNSNEMLRIQDTIFVLWEILVQLINLLYHGSARVSYLSRSVDNLGRIILAIVLDNSTEGILDCRVIAFDKVVFDKTDSER